VLELVDAHGCRPAGEQHRVVGNGRALVEAIEIDDRRADLVGDRTQECGRADRAGALQTDGGLLAQASFDDREQPAFDEGAERPAHGPSLPERRDFEGVYVRIRSFFT
jgi:hypothetical protein